MPSARELSGHCSPQEAKASGSGGWGGCPTPRGQDCHGFPTETELESSVNLVSSRAEGLAEMASSRSLKKEVSPRRNVANLAGALGAPRNLAGAGHQH